MSAYRVIEKKNLWYLLSLLVIGSGVLLMAFRGIQSQPVLNYGIDFVGGNSMLLKFDRIDDQVTGDLSGDENIDFIEGVREVLIGYGLENSSIQINQDRDVMIKTLVDTNIENTQIIDALRETFGQIEVLEIDFIGPTIGKELKDKALLILAVACVALLLFITWRFEFAYGLAALIALFHDALVTVSLSAMIGIEINTAFVAAVLTILGYSINDTIVIFDRIRENYPKLQKQHSLELTQLRLKSTNKIKIC